MKYAFTVLAVLASALFVVSLRVKFNACWLNDSSYSTDLTIWGGAVVVRYVPFEIHRSPSFKVYDDWWFRPGWAGVEWPPVMFIDESTGHLPLWPLIVASLGPAAYLWIRDRKHPPGHCLRCGYNLTGNTSGVCPECSTKVIVDQMGG